jgi:hypothetical protein
MGERKGRGRGRDVMGLRILPLFVLGGP